MNLTSLLFVLLLFFASLPVILKKTFSKNKYYKLIFIAWNVLYVGIFISIAPIFISSDDLLETLNLAVNFSFYLYAVALWISPSGFKGVNTLLNNFFSIFIIVLSSLMIVMAFLNNKEIGDFFGGMLILIDLMIIFGTIYMLPLSLYLKIKEKIVGYI